MLQHDEHLTMDTIEDQVRVTHRELKEKKGESIDNSASVLVAADGDGSGGSGEFPTPGAPHGHNHRRERGEKWGNGLGYRETAAWPWLGGRIAPARLRLSGQDSGSVAHSSDSSTGAKAGWPDNSSSSGSMARAVLGTKDRFLRVRAGEVVAQRTTTGGRRKETAPRKNARVDGNGVRNPRFVSPEAENHPPK